jgi:hypothetical protein
VVSRAACSACAVAAASVRSAWMVSMPSTKVRGNARTCQSARPFNSRTTALPMMPLAPTTRALYVAVISIPCWGWKVSA